MAFLLAQKLHMSQRFVGDVAVPVTVLAVSPCVVAQVRTSERDGYAAVQLGTGNRKRVTKAMAGHLAAAGTAAGGTTPLRLRSLREFDALEVGGRQREVGDRIEASVFKPGDFVRVTAISKGKGFQGPVKRHHFHGQDATHGTKDQLRMPGSISGRGRGGGGPVNKGQRMAGRMGGDRVTVRNLEVIHVDDAAQRIELKGAVPGARGSLVEVRTYEGYWK